MRQGCKRFESYSPFGVFFLHSSPDQTLWFSSIVSWRTRRKFPLHLEAGGEGRGGGNLIFSDDILYTEAPSYSIDILSIRPGIYGNNGIDAEIIVIL